jgi:monoamine oxidase
MASRSEPDDVIVIGGGISGLAAARGISRAGFRVILIEARARMGGRIHTQRPKESPRPIEMGAEFIHGGNPDLWRLVRESHVRTRKLPDRHWLSRGGAVEIIANLDKTLGSVTSLIDPAEAADLSFAAYFKRYPAKVAPDAWMLARGFVEGFEAAPLDRISARSLAGESMDDQNQFVVPGGYDKVITRLVDDCARRGVRMLSEMIVRAVEWRRGRVGVRAHDSISGIRRVYSACAAVIALPLGVLKARGGPAAVRFHPVLKPKKALIDRMEVGQVFRISIRFGKESWRRMLPGILRTRRRHGFGFIHSSAKAVPVWWSLDDQPIMVGWAGGPAAKALLKASKQTRRNRALASLAEILGVPQAQVRAAALDFHEWDWASDPFARGAYSFTAAGEDGSGSELARPMQATLFFAGEATAEGAEVGTVHGALRSGIRAAKEVKKALGRASREAKSA